jgi:hypothetical protein
LGDLGGKGETVADVAVVAGGGFVVRGAAAGCGVGEGAVVANVVGDGVVGADGDADVAAVGEALAAAAGGSEINVFAIGGAAE